MGRIDRYMDNNPSKTAEEMYEIIDSFFDSCENWQCRKCGMKRLENKYHRCDANITKTVCEYCRYYADGKCRLRR